MYNSIQSQLSEINLQLNFVLNILTQVSQKTGIQQEKIQIIDENMNDIISTMIELTNDSEMIHSIKGVKTNEENNK
jgi:hypothetical protein